MKQNKKIHGKRFALLSAVLVCSFLAGCGVSPDSVEDPLAQYNVNAALPFATQVATATPAPTAAPQETWYAAPVTTPPAATATPTSAGYRDIVYGESGESVSEMQGRLKALGYYSGALDGKFGESTASAIRLFQSQLGVSVTGLATGQLQRMLFSSSAPRYNTGMSDASLRTPAPSDDPFGDYPLSQDDFGSGTDYPDDPVTTPRPTAAGYTTLSRGSKGSAVSKLQQALKTLGYYSGSVDGDYGSATVSAVTRFQYMYGQNRDGIATPALQRKLYSGTAVRYQPPATPAPTVAPIMPDAPQPGDLYHYVQLEPGDTGASVKVLQTRLKALGYFNGELGGNYLTLTTNAVKLFQQALGVERTGIATVALQRRLFADDAPAYQVLTPTSAPYADLREGSRGSAVQRLQQRLTDLGYYRGGVTGAFGKNTAAAVKLFQRAIGASQTGVATAALQTRLFSADAPAYQTSAPSAYIDLQEGSSGSAVQRLQQRLADLGYYSGGITGGFGKNTTAAVKLFQRAIDVRQTGIATSALQQVLFSADAPHFTPAQTTPTETPQFVLLKPGSTGDRVKSLQRRLKQLGYFDGDIGGNYLSKTTAAVKRFQVALGVDVTGVATAELQTILFSDTAPANGSGQGASLGYQDTGDAVYRLQLRLIELGFMSDFGADSAGTYGRETQQGVINAQLARGRDSDGRADAEFLRFILSDAARDIALVEIGG